MVGVRRPARGRSPRVLRAAVMGGVGAARAGDRPAAPQPRRALCRRGRRAAAGRPVAGPVVRLRAVGARDRRRSCCSRRAGPTALAGPRAARRSRRRRSPCRSPRSWSARRSSCCSASRSAWSRSRPTCWRRRRSRRPPCSACWRRVASPRCARRPRSRSPGVAGCPRGGSSRWRHAGGGAAVGRRWPGRARRGGALLLAAATVAGVLLGAAARLAAGWSPRRRGGGGRRRSWCRPSPGLAAAGLGARGVRRRPGRRAGARRGRRGGRGRRRRPRPGGCRPLPAPARRATGCRWSCSPTSTPTTSTACPACCAAGGSARSASGRYGEPAGELDRVRRWAAAARVPVTAGGRRRAGAGRAAVLAGALAGAGHQARARCPTTRASSCSSRARGLRLLLTGDVEPPAQRALLATAAACGRGRRAQGGPPRLGLPGARAARAPSGRGSRVISVGADNDYGHPAPPTAARAATRPARWWGAPTATATLLVVGPPARSGSSVRPGSRCRRRSLTADGQPAGPAPLTLVTGPEDAAARPGGRRGGRGRRGPPTRTPRSTTSSAVGLEAGPGHRPGQPVAVRRAPR